MAGEAKGFQLRMPRGSATRPTSDKVREAVYAILGERVVDARVLDLFSGTGALAIEAISRGAQFADLVEADRDACRVIRLNLQATRFADKARLHCSPVTKVWARLTGPFDLVLADPPYGDPSIDQVMHELDHSDTVSPDGTVVLEHSKRFTSSQAYGRLKRRQLRRYGDTEVSFYQLGEETACV